MISKTEEIILRFLYEKKEAAQDEREIAAICAGTGLTRQVVRRTLRQLQEKKIVDGAPDLLAQTMAALKDQDKNFTPTDPGYAEHVVLLASAISQADEQFLADELGYDIDFVSLVGSRLRSSGIWVGDRLSVESRKQWCEEDGGTVFYLEGAVATGDLIVAPERGDSGERRWKMTDAGMKRAAALIKEMSKRKKSQ